MADNSETISDIQNYLQSFNKEIGESGDKETAFYAIDGQKWATTGIDESTLQMLAQQASTSGGDGGVGGIPFAIMPDSESGGYVILVQQSGTTTPDTPLAHTST